MDLFLLETKNDLNQFKQKIEENEGIHVIASSTETHLQLIELGISHDVIDDYLNNSDYDRIDKLSINFAINWYKQKDVNLDFFGLNLGHLVESDIKHYFLDLLRKFFGINNIIKKHKPKKLFVGTLSPISKIIAEKNNIPIYEVKSKDVVKIEGEELEIPIPFSKSHSLKISRKQYLTMKKIVEKILVSTKYENDSEKSILLLDFNPVYFSDMLLKFSQNFKNIFLLNQRRSAIWNIESLKIVKKLGCKILNLDNFNNNDSQKEIILEQDKFLENNLNLRNNKNLREFFTIDEFSLWIVIQDKLIKIIESRGKEMIFRNILVKKLFKKIKFSLVFEWAYTGFEERIVNNEANIQEIPIVFLQHSIIVEEPKYDIFLPFQPTLPKKEDKIAVYGSLISNFIKSKGISENQIIVAGSTRHDSFFKSRKNVQNNNSVVIATSSAYPRYKADGNDIRAYDKLQKTIQRLLLELKKYPEKNPIIKLHPRKDYFELASYIKKIDKNVSIFRDQKSIDFLKDCDVLISTNFSTILLEGMILGKPTMWISTQREHLLNEEIIKNKATLFVSDLNKIDDALKKILTDEQFRNNLIKNANRYIDQYFANQGDASEYLAEKFQEMT